MKLHNFFKTAVLGMALFMMGNVQAQVPNYVPTDGLVGYWGFNGNANDSSGNNNNGTLNGATLTTDRFGSTNSALKISAVNQILCTTNKFTNPQNFSYSVWVKSSSTKLGYVVVFDEGQCKHVFAWDRSLQIDNSSVSFRTYIGNGTNVYNTKTINILDNKWHNIVVTFDNLGSKMYIDGSLVSSKSNQNIAENTSGWWRLGGVDSADSLIGDYDDFGIWNRTLTQAEITALYTGSNYSDTCNAVSGSLTQGLVGYWPFCGNANDDSGHGNNGTVNGATLTTDRFGNANGAYDFGEIDDYIEIPTTNGQFDNEQFTISYWFKSNQNASNPNGGPNVNPAIISRLNSGGPSANPPTAVDNFVIYEIGGSNHFNTPFNGGATGSNTVLGNVWRHIVFSVKSDSTTTYLNGAKIGSSLNNGKISFQNYPIRLGKSKHTYWKDFTGNLDDIGIWNRALTETEITNLYNANQCFNNITVTDTLIINVGQLSYTNPITYANAITIAPNPASTQVNINFSNITDLNGGTIKIINSLGQQVATTTITATGTNTTMTLNTWGGHGMYFVQIVNPQGQIVDIKKIILQ